MIDATTEAPLELANYPAVRQISVTQLDCDLLSRVLTVVLGQCEANAAASDPLAMLSASWLRDEIKRLGQKFAGA